MPRRLCSGHELDSHEPKDPFRQNFFGGGGERRGYHHGRLKDALIEAARSLLAERGPAGFTLAEAAKAVGVTGAAPYRHFSDRNALVSELAKRGFDAFGQKLAAAWDGGKPDPITAFRRMGTAYLAFAREEPGLYMAMFGNVKALANGESGEAATRAIETLRSASAAILRQFGASETGAKNLAFQIWSASHGVAMLALSGHLDAAQGCDPEPILQQTAYSLVEAAIRQGLNEKSVTR